MPGRLHGLLHALLVFTASPPPRPLAAFLCSISAFDVSSMKKAVGVSFLSCNKVPFVPSLFAVDIVYGGASSEVGLRASLSRVRMESVQILPRAGAPLKRLRLIESLEVLGLH